MRNQVDGTGQAPAATMPGAALAQLLRSTRAGFLSVLEREQLSEDYLKQSGFIIEEYATFCERQEAGQPWQLREKYLASRAALRSQHGFSISHLKSHRRQLGYFLRWYQQQAAAHRVTWGELSTQQLPAYWRAERRQRTVLPYRRRILSRHLKLLLQWLKQQPELISSDRLNVLLDKYFEHRHQKMRGEGYGFVLTHRAQMVTRRHLIWLEQRGCLPLGTVRCDVNRASQRLQNHQQALLESLVAKVDRQLPKGLRQPLLEYLEYLVYQCGLAKNTVQAILHTHLVLIRQLACGGHRSFARVGPTELDQLVQSRLSAPREQVLRRRRQIQREHSKLRGFLRYLQRRGLLKRDLAAGLISPPCYRATRPPTVLSEQQVHWLLDSVDRRHAKGRRSYAILLLMSTYGLRPVDVSRLTLDDLRWRAGQLALLQQKTGGVLTLPLLPEVVAALADYLRQDRLVGLPHRRVFVSLLWPHRPLRSADISVVVSRALRAAGLSWACPRHLRSTVATHLLRQGEALRTIQDVLGHRSADTTQRYALADVELLRRVIEESET